MPSDVLESPHFKKGLSKPNRGSICFSAYQRQLNNLYLISSPLIEAIFGLRTSGISEHLSGDPPSSLLKQTISRLHEWEKQLPSNLTLDLEKDVPADSSLERKVYTLQALALQLTFDSIIIISYRSFLMQKVDSLSVRSPRQAHDQIGNFLDLHLPIIRS